MSATGIEWPCPSVSGAGCSSRRLLSTALPSTVSGPSARWPGGRGGTVSFEHSERAIFGLAEQPCDFLVDLTLGLFGVRPARNLVHRIGKEWRLGWLVAHRTEHWG